MGQPDPGVMAVLWAIKIVMFIYDIISLSVYFVLQQPWQIWKKQSTVFGRRLKEGDPSSPCVRMMVREPKNNFHRIETMDQFFRNAVKRYGDKPLFGTREKLGEEEELQKSGKVFKKFILGDYKWLSYKQVDKKVDNFSKGLLNLGVKPRQRIAILAETRVEWMIAAQACFRVNIPLVTLYATLGSEGMSHVINETEITHLITSQDLLSKIQEIIPKLPRVKCIIYMEGMKPPKVQFNDSIKVLPFKEVEKLGESKIPDIAGESPVLEDTIIIMYTSGSTGIPKGVTISHKNMFTVAKGYEYIWPDPQPHDMYIAYLPLAHILELTAESFLMSIGIPTGYSSSITLTDNSTGVRRQDRGDVIVLQPTILMAVPLILDKICKSIIDVTSAKGDFWKLLFFHCLRFKQFWMKRGFGTPILNRLIFAKIKSLLGGRIRCIGCGGAPLSAETQGFIKACLDCHLIQCYALTETAAGGTAMEVDDNSTGGIGSPLPGCYIRIIDWVEGGYRATDKPHPRGEIVIGGDMISPGYFKNEELTKESFYEENGIRWFYSGDVGKILPNGTFKIIDRKKDLVKLQHGEYVSLSKVEADIKTSLIVDNICVYGNGLKDYLVALVLPNRIQLTNLAKTLGKGHLQWTELCSDPVIEVEATKIILEHCKLRKLQRTDTPLKYKLCAENWLPDNGLLTAAYKLRRKAIQEFYEKDIDRMYTS